MTSTLRPPPTAAAPALGPLAAFLVIGTFASTIANTLVTVPLATITADLGAPLTAGTLVVVAFNLTCAATLPFAGWLGDRFGRRPVFLLSMIGVAAGATGAALAPTLPWLIAFRAVQGFSGALVLPTVLALLTAAAGPRRRGRAVAWWAAANGAGQAAGPVAGGLLTDTAGWRAVFVVIVPVALVALVGAWFRLPRTAPRAVGLDIPGASLLAGATAALLIGAAASGAAGFGSPLAWCGFGAGLVALAAFVAVEHRRAAPFIPLGLLVEPRFARSTLAALAQMMCLTATLLAAPLYLVTLTGTSVRGAGLLVAALPLAMTALAPVAGRLTERWSPRRALRCGLLLLAAAELGLAGAFALPAPGTGAATWVAVVTSCVFVGAGMALTQTPAAAGAARTAQQADSGAALGVFNMMRFVGAALGGVLVAAVIGDTPAAPAPFIFVAATCAAASALALTTSFAAPQHDSDPNRTHERH